MLSVCSTILVYLAEQLTLLKLTELAVSRNADSLKGFSGLWITHTCSVTKRPKNIGDSQKRQDFVIVTRLIQLLRSQSTFSSCATKEKGKKKRVYYTYPRREDKKEREYGKIKNIQNLCRLIYASENIDNALCTPLTCLPVATFRWHKSR